MVVYRANDGKLVEVARAGGDETLEVTHPFPVSIIPRRLVGHR